MSITDNDPLLSVTDVAEMLGVHHLMIRRRITTGEIPAIRVGRLIRVRKSAVDAFIKPIVPRAEVERDVEPEIETGCAQDYDEIGADEGDENGGSSW